VPAAASSCSSATSPEGHRGGGPDLTRPPLGAHRRALRPAPRRRSHTGQRRPARAPRLSPVTLVCALIEGRRLTLAAAHPPPLLRRGGEVREIGRHGALLGALATSRPSRTCSSSSRATRCCSTPTA
jgi:hypothetical protein